MVQFDLEDGKLSFSLIPLDLGMDRENPLHRGLPEIASTETGKKIAAELTRKSACYGTRLRYDEESGEIRVI